MSEDSSGGRTVWPMVLPALFMALFCWLLVAGERADRRDAQHWLHKLCAADGGSPDCEARITAREPGCYEANNHNGNRSHWFDSAKYRECVLVSNDPAPPERATTPSPPAAPDSPSR